MPLYSTLYQKILPFIGRCIFFLLLFANFIYLPWFISIRNDKTVFSYIAPAILALAIVGCVRKPSKFGFFCVFTLCISYILYDIAALVFYSTGSWYIWTKLRVNGFLPFIVLGVYLIVGFLHAKHIRTTRYNLTTKKALPGGHLRIVQLSDIHPGTNMTISAIPKIRRIVEELNPDIIVLTGDIFDENTRPKFFDAYCNLLTSLPSRYGTWYIYGNHDADWHWKKPNHTKDDIELRLTGGGIHILEDETSTLCIDGARINIAGRCDISLSNGERMTAENLTKFLSGYTILLDHQPVEFKAAAEAGVDLLLTGHTHGGQIFPLGWFSHRILRMNELNYGMKKLSDSCTAIVSCGMGTWSYPIRTEGRTEIVCIDINKINDKRT